MRNALWRATLEIATLLGGLSSLLFFFDRFRHHLQRYNVRLVDGSNSRRYWSIGTTVACLAGCIAVGIVGFEFGVSVYIDATFVGAFCVFLFAELVRRLGHPRLGEASAYAGIAIFIPALLSMIATIIFNAVARGVGDHMDTYAGSRLSIFSAVLCFVQGIYCCYGLLRLNWLGEPWGISPELALSQFGGGVNSDEAGHHSDRR
jgi:hypothetical protein